MKKFLSATFFYVLLTTSHVLFPPSAYAFSDTVYFIHTDHLGSVIAVSDEAGNLVQQTKYAPYGYTSEESRSLPRHLGGERSYTGQIKDASTALQYYNARYYDPVISRFTSADSVGGGNRFTYVGGNPVMRSDPTGNREEEKAPKIYDETYGSSYFSDLIEKWIFPTEQKKQEWSTLSSTQRVDILSVAFSNEIPYSPKMSKLFDREDYLYQQKNAILNRMTNTDDVDSPNRLYNQLASIEKHLGRDSDLQKEMDAFHHQKREMSPWQRYESGYWVCNEFSELLGEQVKNFVPEIEIYQLAVLISGGAHAVPVYRNEKGSFMTVDPTWGWTSIPLEEDIKYRNWRDFGLDDPVTGLNYSEKYFYGKFSPKGKAIYNEINTIFKAAKSS